MVGSKQVRKLRNTSIKRSWSQRQDSAACRERSDHACGTGLVCLGIARHQVERSKAGLIQRHACIGCCQLYSKTAAPVAAELGSSAGARNTSPSGATEQSEMERRQVDPGHC
jgi:hypothetical protein